MKKFILILFLSLSCSSQKTTLMSNNREIEKWFDIQDASGKFRFWHKNIIEKNKIITQNKILTIQNGDKKVLEKSVLVSELGRSRLGNKDLKIRPVESETVLWIENEEKNIRSKLDLKSKQLYFWSKNNSIWKESKKFHLPHSGRFCFFSQIADCLVRSGWLPQIYKNKKPVAFYVIWESYPFHRELYENLSAEPLSKAQVEFVEREGDLAKFEVEVDGQSIFYYFSSKQEWVKMIWISQGLTLTQ